MSNDGGQGIRVETLIKGVPKDHYRMILIRGNREVTTEVDMAKLDICEGDVGWILQRHLERSLKAIRMRLYCEKYEKEILGYHGARRRRTSVSRE